MLSDYLWKTTTRVLVTAHGGGQDGAQVLCNNLKPGTKVNLHGHIYAMVWHGDTPRLEAQ